MSPQEQQDKINQAVALLREVATDTLRECEACALPCSNVRIDPDHYPAHYDAGMRKELVGECPEHGTVVVWPSGNSVNAGDAILPLTGYRLDPSEYPTFQ